MTINKLTLAAALTLGLMAGTMNAGIASTVDISDIDMAKLASCPLSDCDEDRVTPDTAVCPYDMQENDAAPTCGCNDESITGAAAPCDDDVPAPCGYAAPACGCDSCDMPLMKSSNVPQKCDGKHMNQQTYAYPASIYSDSQRVGSTSNNIIIGESKACGCSLCPNPGVPVAMAPSCGCNGTTGAAAALPIFGQSFNLDSITGAAAPISSCGCNTGAAAPCGIEIATPSSLEAINRRFVPFTPPAPVTGAAAPVAAIPASSVFEDIPYGFWANCDINKLAANGVVVGYPDRTFKPNKPISRAEFASMLVNGMNLSCEEHGTAKIFKDVPESHWANQQINVSVANGLMEGYPNKAFKPNANITRAEAMATLAKGIPCEMDTCKADSILSQYPDGHSVPAWARIPVAKTIETGALKDIPGSNSIQSNRTASRAEVASMLEQVRVAMGYSKNDIAAAEPCDSCTTGGAAFMAIDDIVQVPTLKLEFQDEISAMNATIGDRFAAKTTEPVTINGVTFPEGANVYGTVTEVTRPSGTCGGSIKLSFEKIKHGSCHADLPQQVLTAQVNDSKKPNVFARIIEAPFTWTGSILGTIGRTVGGAIVALGNATEHVVDGVGLAFGETLQGELPAAGRSLFDSGKALVKAPVDLTRTALSGTAGLFETTIDQAAYLVDPKGNMIVSVNPRECITIAFGQQNCTACGD